MQVQCCLRKKSCCSVYLNFIPPHCRTLADQRRESTVISNWSTLPFLTRRGNTKSSSLSCSKSTATINLGSIAIKDPSAPSATIHGDFYRFVFSPPLLLSSKLPIIFFFSLSESFCLFLYSPHFHHASFLSSFFDRNIDFPDKCESKLR